MPNSATFLVPGTTSNLGPGYDCLGAALQIYNRVTVRRADGEAGVSPPGEMAAQAAKHFFEACGTDAFPFSWEICGDVPQSRGLGSSVTVRLGLMHGLNALAGEPLQRERLFALCAALEGHPDNAAPAAFGGFTVAGGSSTARFEIGSELKFVLLIPYFEISTPEARKVLPPQLDRLSAVASLRQCLPDHGRLCRAGLQSAARRFRRWVPPAVPPASHSRSAPGNRRGRSSGSARRISFRLRLDHLLCGARRRGGGGPGDAWRRDLGRGTNHSHPGGQHRSATGVNPFVFHDSPSPHQADARYLNRCSGAGLKTSNNLRSTSLLERRYGNARFCCVGSSSH